MTPRANPDYAGGTAVEREHRETLRHAMESHGFTVDPGEWWHFDFSEWKQYPIINVPFDAIR
jgi:D-alanyl-D-alanine dipeptidase